MAFKINKSVIQGTTGHASALKQVKDKKMIGPVSKPNPKNADGTTIPYSLNKKTITADPPVLRGQQTKKKVDHNKNLKSITDPKKRSDYYKKHNLKQDETTNEGGKPMVDAMKKGIKKVFKKKNKKKKEDTITVGDVAKTLGTLTIAPGIQTGSSKKVFNRLGKEVKKGYKKVKNKVTDIWNTEL